MDSQKLMLGEIILREDEMLKTLEPGTDEYRRVAAEFNEHYKLYLDYDKQRRDRRSGFAGTLVSALIPAAAYVGLSWVGIKLDLRGYCTTSPIVRGIFSKITPKR